MTIVDFFEKEGVKVLFEGSKPQILDDPDFVWLVGSEKIFVFITVLSSDGQPGVKNFLFEAGAGELLFGLTPEEVPEKMALLATGPSGSSLIRLEVKRLKELQAGEISREAARLSDHWLENLRKACGSKEDDQRPVIRLIAESWQKQNYAEMNRIQKE